MKESVTLSSREIRRMHVLERVLRGTLTLVEAVPLLLVCYRQAKRLLARYRKQGAAGLAHRRRGQPPPRHRSRRPRRPQMGLLMQWDGSPHRWFGPTRPSCTLLHATDDATGTVLGAKFRPTEDAIGYLKVLDQVLRRHGVPVAVYQDRHAALCRSDDHWSHEEELAGVRFPTHVGRVLRDLTIEPITASSAQAKR